MGTSFTFPVQDGGNVTNRLTRWVSRWRNGGVENYAGQEPSRDLRDAWFADRFVVHEERIWIDGLPEVFAPLKIVQLSDIHPGLFLPEQWLADAVEQANRLAPDIIALTGDFITYSRNNIEPAAALLGRLRARHGVLAVLGN